MFELLEGFYLSEEIINFLEEICSDSERREIKNCVGRFYSSVMYLREIGVTNKTIEDIIAIDHHVLLAGKDEIKRALSKIDNLNDFVALLNSDIKYMNYLKNKN